MFSRDQAPILTVHKFNGEDPVYFRNDINSTSFDSNFSQFCCKFKVIKLI